MARKQNHRRRQENDTEQTIVQVATEFFREKGYNGTSMADLAGAVGIQTASLYYYAASKQALLLQVLETGMDGFLARLEEICATELSSREKLRLAVENHLNFIFDRPDAVAVFLRERRFLEPSRFEQYHRKVDRYDALFSDILKQGVAAGEFPPVDPRVTSLAILGMINWIIEWYRPGGRLGRAEICEIMLGLILNRLLANPAR